MGAVEEGIHIRQRIVGNGFFLNIVVLTTLIDMYVKCEIVHKVENYFTICMM